MESITKTEFNKFVAKVAAAMHKEELLPLDPYDLRHYCNTLINGASLFQLIGSMECSDRIDLIDSDNEGGHPSCDALADKFKKFTMRYLGLELLTHGDPRGAVFKLVVDPSLGDSFGDRTHLCVPCIDCYQSLN